MDNLNAQIGPIYVIHPDSEELNEFVDSLPTNAFEGLQGFFTDMPKLSHDVKYKVGKKKKTRC